MLDADLAVEFDGLRDQVRVEFVHALVKERREVTRQLVGLLETGSEPVGQGRDVGHVHVLRELGLLLDSALELGVVVLQEPLEDGLLDLLVVFLFEELVLKEGHRTHHEELAALRAHVKGGHRPVSRVADRPRGQDGETGLADVERGTIGIDELEAAVLIAGQLVLGVLVALGELGLAVRILLFGLTLRHSRKSSFEFETYLTSSLLSTPFATKASLG